MGQTFLSALAEGQMSVPEPRLKVTRRRLPHWTLDGSLYFVTFRLFRTRLERKEIQLVRDEIVSGETHYYDLLAAAVLPNHVHLLLRPRADYSLSRVMKGIKGVTARELNTQRGTRGSVWQDESFDRIVRDQAELQEKLEYMLRNPVEEGLTDDPAHYEGWYLNLDMLRGQTGMSAPPRQNLKSKSKE